MKRCLIILLVVLFAVMPPGIALAGLVKGPDARTQFEDFQHSHCDTFIDFESLPTGLYDELTGFPLTLNTTYFRWPLPGGPAPPNTPVALLPTGWITTPPNHRLMGVTASHVPDGQSAYEINFDEPQRRVGLYRIWNTYSITRFYSGSTLLADHINETNHQFVGYICESDDPDTWITRVEFDGIPLEPESEDNKLYMVGEVDDLFYSTPSLQLSIKCEPAEVNTGEKTTASIDIKNIASYAKADIRIDVEFYSHEQNENIQISILREIPPEDILTLNYVISVPEGSSEGQYSVKTTIYSPADVKIDSKTASYDVQQGDIGELPPPPIGFILLCIL
jgi:hypothetical protein